MTWNSLVYTMQIGQDWLFRIINLNALTLMFGTIRMLDWVKIWEAGSWFVTWKFANSRRDSVLSKICLQGNGRNVYSLKETSVSLSIHGHGAALWQKSDWAMSRIHRSARLDQVTQIIVIELGTGIEIPFCNQVSCIDMQMPFTFRGHHSKTVSVSWMELWEA